MLGILEKISPSELVSNGYISNHNKVRRLRPKFKVCFFFFFYIFLLFLNQCYSNKLWNINNKKYKERFLIVVSSWNRDLTLMLERPLSHYWTSPLMFWSNEIHSPLEYEGSFPLTRVRGGRYTNLANVIFWAAGRGLFIHLLLLSFYSPTVTRNALSEYA